MTFPTPFVAREPMKASDFKGDMSELSYPLFVSPKLDGIRAVNSSRGVVSKSLKLIPNKYVQTSLAEYPHGLDGELVVGSPTDDPYRRSMSGVMTEVGEPNFTFWVFDNQAAAGGFNERFATLADFSSRRWRGFVRVVPHYLVKSAAQLQDFEERFIAEGYEGAMLRSPSGIYKHGRSTVNEGHLLKLKRFRDGEATVYSYEAQMANHNEAKRDAFGRIERSSSKGFKEELPMLGALQVVGNTDSGYDGVEFSVGTGFKAQERADLWRKRDELPGRVIKFRYFPSGSKERPRFPTFLGFRAEADL